MVIIKQNYQLLYKYYLPSNFIQISELFNIDRRVIMTSMNQKANI